MSFNSFLIQVNANEITNVANNGHEHYASCLDSSRYNEVKQLMMHSLKHPTNTTLEDVKRLLLSHDGQEALSKLQLPMIDLENITHPVNGTFVYKESYIKEFHYDIVKHSEALQCLPQNVVLEIQEKYMSSRKYSSGGSTFRVMTEGLHSMERCSMLDQGNGSYSVCCNVREYCSNISVILLYPEYTAYIPKRKLIPARKSIYESVVVCPKVNMLSGKGSVGTGYSYTVEDTSYRKLNQRDNHKYRIDLKRITNNGVWYKSHKSYLYIEGTINLSVLNMTAMRQCIKKFHFYIIGDSHGRHYTNYILNLMQEYKNTIFNYPKFWNHKTGKYTFWFRGYCLDVYNALKQLNKRANVSDSQSVLIVTTGTWSTNNCKQIHGYRSDMLRLARLVSKMKKSSVWKKTNIFFITQPPYPEMKSNDKRYCRNNFNAGLGAAFDKAVMESAGVNVIDAYTLLVSRNDEGINFDHYMTTFKNKTYSCVEHGTEGMLVVHKLLQQLCGSRIFNRN